MENLPLRVFEEYLAVTSRHQELTDQLASGALVDDDTVRGAYSLAQHKLGQRITQLAARPSDLIDGAFASVEQAGRAVEQLVAIEDILGAEQLSDSYATYRSKAQRAVSFIMEHVTPADPRVEQMTITARSVGVVAVREAAASTSETAGLDPVERVVIHASTLPMDAPQVLTPGELWALATNGREYTRDDRNQMRSLVNELRKRGVDISFNGQRNRGARYTLSTFTGEISPAGPKLIDKALPLWEAASIASFFGLFREVLAAKEVAPLGDEVIAQCIDALPADAPVENGDVANARKEIANRIKKLVDNPKQIDRLLQYTNKSDPRYALLAYLKTLGDKSGLLVRFAGTYRDLRQRIAISNKDGGVAVQEVEVTAVVDDELVGDSDAARRRARERDLLRLMRDADATMGDLSPSAKIAAERALEEAVAQIAQKARENNLLPDQPHAQRKISAIFPEFVSSESGSTTLVEVATLLVMGKGLLAHYTDDDKALLAVGRYWQSAWRKARP